VEITEETQRTLEDILQWGEMEILLRAGKLRHGQNLKTLNMERLEIKAYQQAIDQFDRKHPWFLNEGSYVRMLRCPACKHEEERPKPYTGYNEKCPKCGWEMRVRHKGGENGG
jgi:hypothetical protein